MKATALALIACLLGTAVASGPDTLWVRTLDKGSDEIGTGVASRGDAIAAIGYFFGPNFNYDWVVARLDQDGDTVWTRTYDGGADEDAVATCIDAESNIVVSGRGYSFSSAVGGRLSPRDHGRLWPRLGRDEAIFAMAAKYDSLGELEWLRADTNCAATGIAVDSAGNCYVCGGRIIDDMHWDTWIAKLSPSGDSLWSKIFDFAPLEMAYGPAIDESGNIAMCIYAGDTTEFDCLTVKLAPDGTLAWTSRYNFGPDDAGTGVAIDRNHNVLVAGRAMIDTLGYALILKYDSGGALVWDRRYEGDQAFGTDCDSAGNVYIAGCTGGGYPADCLTLKLDSMGKLVWRATFGGGGDEGAFDVACDPDGNPIVVGSLNDSVTSSLDLLVMKYSAFTGIAESPHSIPMCAPARSTITADPEFVLAVETPGRYDVKLCDVSGRTRQQLFRGTLTTGAHRLSVSALPAGTYFVRVAAPDGGISGQRLMVVK